MEQAQQRFTGDRDVLTALAQFSARDGDAAAAKRWAQRLHDLDAGEYPPPVGAYTPSPAH